eukprot:2054052-Karenia_brevis.AAC.1
MWAIFYSALRVRNSASFKIKKTKGHALADEDFLAKSPHLKTEAVYNNYADAFVGKASKTLLP